MKEALEAEQEEKRQRLNSARGLQVDETKATSASYLMLLHRVRGAAAERSEAFDTTLRDRDMNKLFNSGALYFGSLSRANPP